jgi:hypothetical protein
MYFDLAYNKLAKEILISDPWRGSSEDLPTRSSRCVTFCLWSGLESEHVHYQRNKTWHVRCDDIAVYLKEKDHYYWTFCECFEARYALCEIFGGIIVSF